MGETVKGRVWTGRAFNYLTIVSKKSKIENMFSKIPI
jgi:hypothetical protein